ncbi:MAG: FAD-binding oxidoreductase [Chloroflexi bacterium]|nr:MAG: FAD-binding oxidoreductase [Chloroflexota bacterium]
MTKANTSFIPPWYEGASPEGSYRSLFKWGDLAAFKHPNKGMYHLLKKTFNLSDNDFQKPENLGLDPLDIGVPIRLDPTVISRLQSIVGNENLTTETYDRIKASYGKGMLDALRLRFKIIENLPDAVLYPCSKEEVQAVVAFCQEQRIPVYPKGGGSSVTRGTEAVRGGICLDLSRRMNQVIGLNEVDQTITVQPGISGPELERIANNAPEILAAARRYTVGHFPQSFEFSTVGGWVVTRGAGQNSTYYGKIEDIVLSQEYVTPVGVLKTPKYPRAALGPDLNQLMVGSEGTFGVLTEVTLKLRRYMPENTLRFSYLFKTWDEARNACREIIQSEAGFPSVFRLSDPEETEVGMYMYGIYDSPAAGFLEKLGFQPMKRCLLVGSIDGARAFTQTVRKSVSQVCRGYRVFNLSPFQITKRWEHGRFRDPYMREDLQDFGILTDTLECAVRWDQMDGVYQKVRAYVKSRPRTICMTHLSHAYPQGGNLYFIFIGKMDGIEEYLQFQVGLLDAIRDSGAGMSHHHGIGKQTAPWFVEQIGETSIGVLRNLKGYFDPEGIMNPGGTLGLDETDKK